MIIYQRVFKLWSGHENVSELIKRKQQNAGKRELSFLYATHQYDLFFINAMYHDNIPRCIQVTERTRI